MVKILEGDELHNLLRKALEVETGFESVAQWEGYVATKSDEFREVLFRLISDSEGHRRSVESLMAQVRVGGDTYGVPIRPREAVFRGKSDLEVMTEISKMEILMYNLYSDIRKALVESDISALLKDGSDRSSFISELESLIKDEDRHMKMVSQYVRNVDRLR